jgi:transcriptional regulator with XRE-family HTH domain
MIRHKTLGAELRKAREAAGLTEEQLAGLANIRPFVLRQIEKGTRSPTVDVLLRLCGGLGLRASRIVAHEEQNGRNREKRRDS